MKKNTLKFKYVGGNPIQALVGAIVNIYGFGFVWDGKEAVCSMTEDYRGVIEDQIKKGRPFEIIDETKPAKIKPKPAEPKAAPDGGK